MSRRTLSTLAVAAWLLATASAASAAPPSNDEFERAAPLDGTIAGTVDEATRQEGEPPHGSQTVWYAYRAPANQRVAVELMSASIDVTITVYTGASLAALHQVGTTRDAPQPRVALDAVAGETYWVVVSPNYEAGSTRFELRVGPAALPANDAFADARRVTVPSRHAGSLADATGELGEPRFGAAAQQQTVWYRFRAPRTGRLTVEAASASCAAVAVYTGTRLDGLRAVAGSGQSTMRFRARRGRMYRVAVFCGYGAGRDYELTISDGSIKGKGVEVALAAGQTVDGIRARGLRAILTTRRRVTVGIDLLVSPSTARRLDLDSRVLGRATGTLDYNEKLPAAVRLTADAKRALEGETGLSATLRLTLLKTKAPNRVLTVPVRLPN